MKIGKIQVFWVWNICNWVSLDFSFNQECCSIFSLCRFCIWFQVLLAPGWKLEKALTMILKKLLCQMKWLTFLPISCLLSRSISTMTKPGKQSMAPMKQPKKGIIFQTSFPFNKSKVTLTRIQQLVDKAQVYFEIPGLKNKLALEARSVYLNWTDSRWVTINSVPVATMQMVMRLRDFATIFALLRKIRNLENLNFYTKFRFLILVNWILFLFSVIWRILLLQIWFLTHPTCTLVYKIELQVQVLEDWLVNSLVKTVLITPTISKLETWIGQKL